RQHPLLRFLRGGGGDHIGGEEGARRVEVLALAELRAVEVEGPLESVAGEVVREDVRQSERGGERRGVVARTEQPHVGGSGGGGRGVHGVRLAGGGAGPADETDAGPFAGDEAEDVADVLGEAVDVAR